MPIPQADSIHELAFPASAGTGAAAKPSEAECEVIHLFEQFRNPLVRYVVSRGLSVHDGEEIIQEVFLALFRHLQLGKSRRNLPGWVFRVGHTLALKKRMSMSSALGAGPAREAEVCADPAPNPEDQLASNQTQR